MKYGYLAIIGYVLTGLVSGVLGGLLGIGGGVVTVPALNILFGNNVQIAVAASLFTMIFISAAATYGHWRNGFLLRAVIVRLVPLTAVAAIAGAFVGSRFPGWILQLVFGVLLVYISLSQIGRVVRRFAGGKAEEKPVTTYSPPNELVIPLIALPMGFSCGLLGIGGGAIAVPLLHVFARLPLKNAIANSSATILFSAAVAATTKMLAINGMQVPFDSGVITLHWYHPLIIGAILAPTAFIGGRIGAHLTRIAPTHVIRVVFIGILLYAAWGFFAKAHSSYEQLHQPDAAATAPALESTGK